MFYVESQSSRLIGWFPTKELAEQHCRDWPDEGMNVIPGCYITGVVERFPPRMMTEETTKALNDHNANVARMVSNAEWVAEHPGNIITPKETHGDDAFRYKPQEPDDVQRAWLDKVKAENGKAIDLMLIAAFEFGVASVNGPDDGRPCAMDKFVADLFEACDDHYDREAAINHWLHGEWDEAMAYLKDEDAGE